MTCMVPGCRNVKGERGDYCLTHWVRDRELRRAKEKAERETAARIVAWLRAATAATRAIEAERGVPNLASPILQETADRIERGEWREAKGGE